MSSQPDRPGRLAAIASVLLPVAMALGALFLLAVIGGKAVQGYEMRQEARAVERRVEDLKKENRHLSQELEYYRSDQYIEKVAREELGLVRPGDVAIVVSSDDQPSLPALPNPTPTPTPVPGQRDVPTWQRWLSLFVDQN